MTRTQDRPFQIVVGFDFTPEAQVALRLALAQAKQHKAATVHVLNVLGTQFRDRSFHHAPTHDEATTHQEALDSALAIAVGEPPPNIQFFSHARIGAVVETVLELAREVAASMICLGTHGRKGLSRMALGSVAEEVVRAAECPVLVARASSYPQEQGFQPEPPCPQCMEVRKEEPNSWCSAHARKYDPRAAKTRPTQQGVPAEWTLW